MNIITTQRIETAPCPCERDPEALRARYSDYLGDESRLRANSIDAFYQPRSTAELADAMHSLGEHNELAVLSAGRTGIAGGAAPIDANAVISLDRMNRLIALGKDESGWYVRCQPGLTLDELAAHLRKKDFTAQPEASEDERTATEEFLARTDLNLWLPVDPTETSAHLGGTIATNASGARSYQHGAMRRWVRGLNAILSSGEQLILRQGDVAAQDGQLILRHTDSQESTLHIPDTHTPATKNTLGYALHPTMDALDLLIGSEGTLCALAELEIRLAATPLSQMGVFILLPDESQALRLVERLRAHPAIHPDAIEYFDPDALHLVKQHKEQGDKRIPELPSWEGAAIYIELSGDDPAIDTACDALDPELTACGGSLDATWAASEPRELAMQKLVRHAVPEAVNSLIGQRKRDIPGLHKIGTDMAVPDHALAAAFDLYRTGLHEAGLQSVIFGHIGDNHVHVNILPRNADELAAAKELYLNWARRIVELGGAVAAEHGIGRIKKPMLEIQYPREILDAMRAIRHAFDPDRRLAPGVLI